MKCPSCGSRRVERRPPSQISPHPGYHCRNCGLLMRGRGMLFLYLIVLAVGCGFFGLFVFFLARGEVALWQIGTAPIVGAICAVYSVRQLMRPLPRRTRDDEDDDD
ncbi:MAG: hypothetical protein J0I06_11160 [Planctomycetes bacterium]|nr:hypothetical protein [Planctomycetota bacterium]